MSCGEPHAHSEPPIATRSDRRQRETLGKETG